MLFFSHVEKISPPVQDDKKPVIVDFVPKNAESRQEEIKREFLAEVSDTASTSCSCFNFKGVSNRG